MITLVERIGNVELQTDGFKLYVCVGGEIVHTNNVLLKYSELSKSVKSIFEEPTDIVFVALLSDGRKIGKHKSHEDYICEFPNKELSNGFGKQLAMRIIEKDRLTH